MGKNNFLSIQRTIDHLKTFYDIRVDTLTPIALGADIDALIYKAQTPDQLSYFVKLKRNTHDILGVNIQTLL